MCKVKKMNYYVTYTNGNIVNRSVTGSIASIKEAMVSRFPELAGVEPTIDNNNVVFNIPVGTKN